MKEPSIALRSSAVEAGIQRVEEAWQDSKPCVGGGNRAYRHWNGALEWIDADTLSAHVFKLDWMEVLEGEYVYKQRQGIHKMPGLGMHLTSDVTRRFRWELEAVRAVDQHPLPAHQTAVLVEAFRNGFLKHLRNANQEDERPYWARSAVMVAREVILSRIPERHSAAFLHATWLRAMSISALSDEVDFTDEIMWSWAMEARSIGLTWRDISVQGLGGTLYRSVCSLVD